MKKILMVFVVLAQLQYSAAQMDFYSYPRYHGTDLGLTYTASQSIFKVWSPVAEKAELIFYREGLGGEPVAVHPMTKTNGVWSSIIKGDQKGLFYVYRVMINGKWNLEVTDPYSKMVGINGKRSYIADINTTDPAGWEKDKSPLFTTKTSAIIYELHVKDASYSQTSGITNKGIFTGLTETGTRNSAGLTTGLDHMREMGVTHVHLLPFYDYNSVDETRKNAPFNWGYDPLNYNALEGSYSSNAADPLARIREFKQLVRTFHTNGLRVVMDVVYNHTGLTENSNFNQLVPGYYYRQNDKGGFSNGTACGNETASERAMVRKFILESMKFWVEEYHIDGFRVDLMGIHDIETMNIISKELHKIRPDILLYGEGWTAGASPLPSEKAALKKNAFKLDRIAVFNDDIRDGIKGSVFDHPDRGFASGKKGMEESIKFGIVASLQHPQMKYELVNYSKAPYTKQPWQVVTYAECHDNHVLWDKLAISAKDASESERINMHKLALSIVLSSQGIAFLHAGTEFLRTKKGVENSFDSPDSINVIDWDLKTKNLQVVKYVQALIQMRKAHPAFRMMKAEDIRKNINFITAEDNMIVYEINGAAVGDRWKKILVCFNGSSEKKTVRPVTRKWKVYIKNNLRVATEEIITSFDLEAYTCSILYID